LAKLKVIKVIALFANKGIADFAQVQPLNLLNN